MYRTASEQFRLESCCVHYFQNKDICKIFNHINFQLHILCIKQYLVKKCTQCGKCKDKVCYGENRRKSIYATFYQFICFIRASIKTYFIQIAIVKQVLSINFRLPFRHQSVSINKEYLILKFSKTGITSLFTHPSFYWWIFVIVCLIFIGGYLLLYV